MRRVSCVLLILATFLALTACRTSGLRSTPSTVDPSCAAVESRRTPPTYAVADIPHDQGFRDYSPPDNLYTIKVPDSWGGAGGATRIAFRDKVRKIDLSIVDAPTAPTVESAREKDVPNIPMEGFRGQCFLVMDVTTVEREAGKAVLITYEADSAADPYTNKVVRDHVERYQFWKDGKEVIVVLSAPIGSNYADLWRKITDSFTWR